MDNLGLILFFGFIILFPKFALAMVLGIIAFFFGVSL
jgi:hypothetical protein